MARKYNDSLNIFSSNGITYNGGQRTFSTQYSLNIIQSLYYFFNHASYASSGSGFYTTGTLKQQHSGLDIILGHPQPLEELNLPSLAIVEDPTSPEINSFGSHCIEQTFAFYIEGFAGGYQIEERNALLRDQLRDEVRYLLNDTDYINLYTVDADGKIDISFVETNAELQDIRDENLPSIGLLAAEKYRFKVSFNVSFIYEG